MAPGRGTKSSRSRDGLQVRDAALPALGPIGKQPHHCDASGRGAEVNPIAMSMQDWLQLGSKPSRPIDGLAEAFPLLLAYFHALHAPPRSLAAQTTSDIFCPICTCGAQRPGGTLGSMALMSGLELLTMV